MKKILVILVAVVGLGLSANAQNIVFRFKHDICAEIDNGRTKERIIFEKDGTFKLYRDNVLFATGLYHYEKSGKKITLKGGALENSYTSDLINFEVLLTRVDVVGGKVTFAIFNSVFYETCQ